MSENRLRKIEVEEVVEYQVLCPKEGWSVDPDDECSECEHLHHEKYEGKKGFLFCEYQSPNSTPSTEVS